MGRNEKKYGTIGLMILTVIIIFSVVGIVIAGFRMIKKNEDARLISAADTEYNKDKEKRQEIEDHLESDYGASGREPCGCAKYHGDFKRTRSG